MENSETRLSELSTGSTSFTSVFSSDSLIIENLNFQFPKYLKLTLFFEEESQVQTQLRIITITKICIRHVLISAIFVTNSFVKGEAKYRWFRKLRE